MTEKESVNRKRVNFRNFTWPVMLIASGTTLLLNNLGVISWQVWNVIFQFWPVLLILAGIEYILDNNFLGNLILFVVTTSVIIFIFVYSISTVNLQFDKYLRTNYPYWGKIKRVVPENIYKRQMFPCNPLFGNCRQIYIQ